MVIVPVRVPLPLYERTVYVTVPLPVPLAPALMVIKPSFAVAVQLQPLGAVTATDPVSSSPSKFCDVGLIEYTQMPA